MNRRERRAQAKQLRKTKMIGDVSFKSALEWVNRGKDVVPYKDGDSVKINYEFIKRQKEWADLDKEFVEAHKNDLLTVEREENEENPGIAYFVTLKEDTTEPKIQFKANWLIPQATATVKLDSGEEVKVDLGDITDVNDPAIMDKVNGELENEMEN